jgi:hypothetical protein
MWYPDYKYVLMHNRFLVSNIFSDALFLWSHNKIYDPMQYDYVVS